MARLTGHIRQALAGAAETAFLAATEVGLAGFELFNRFRQLLAGRGFTGTSAEIGELFRRERSIVGAGSILNDAAGDEALLLRSIPINTELPDIRGTGDRIAVETLVTIRDAASGITTTERLFLDFRESPSRDEVLQAVDELTGRLAGYPRGPLAGFTTPESVQVVDVRIISVQRRF